MTLLSHCKTKKVKFLITESFWQKLITETSSSEGSIMKLRITVNQVKRISSSLLRMSEWKESIQNIQASKYPLRNNSRKTFWEKSSETHSFRKYTKSQTNRFWCFSSTQKNLKHTKKSNECLKISQQPTRRHWRERSFQQYLTWQTMNTNCFRSGQHRCCRYLKEPTRSLRKTSEGIRKLSRLRTGLTMK